MNNAKDIDCFKLLFDFCIDSRYQSPLFLLQVARCKNNRTLLHVNIFNKIPYLLEQKYPAFLSRKASI